MQQIIAIENLKQIYSFLDGIKGVVFDMDDTVYSEMEYVKSGYRSVAEYLNTAPKGAERMLELFLNDEKPIDTYLQEINMFSEEMKTRCMTIYREHIPDIHLYQEVDELLGKLRVGEYKIGLITDGRPEGQKNKIQVLGLAEKVDFIIITDELGGVQWRKPNSKAFEIMKDMMNLEYSEMVYVGDNIKKDFIAPQKLGMRSIWYKNPEGLYVEYENKSNTEK